MPELRRIAPLSDWFEIEVKTSVIGAGETQKIRLRVKPVLDLDVVDAMIENKVKPSEIILARALDAIQAWDLTDGGTPIPCDDAQKKRLENELRVLLASFTADGKDFVATAVIKKAQVPEDFLKN